MNQPIAARGAEKQTSTFSSRATHWLQHHQREAKASFGRLAQSPLSTLMTVLVMTISLTLPLGLGKLLDDASSAASGWDGEARLSIYLKEETPAEVQASVLARAQALPGIRSARIISSDGALEEFKQQSGYGPALDQLGYNPLPAVLEVFPKNNASSSEMTALRDQLAQWPEVALAEVDIAWVQRLQSMLELGQRLLWAVGGALLLGGLLVVGNTIRLVLTDTTGATDVSGIASLNGASGVTAMSREVLLEMAIQYQGVTLDNTEAITWGKTLANGNRTLVLAVDNNFAANDDINNNFAPDDDNS